MAWIKKPPQKLGAYWVEFLGKRTFAVVYEIEKRKYFRLIDAHSNYNITEKDLDLWWWDVPITLPPKRTGKKR